MMKLKLVKFKTSYEASDAKNVTAPVEDGNPGKKPK